MLIMYSNMLSIFKARDFYSLAFFFIYSSDYTIFGSHVFNTAIYYTLLLCCSSYYSMRQKLILFPYTMRVIRPAALYPGPSLFSVEDLFLKPIVMHVRRLKIKAITTTTTTTTITTSENETPH